MRSTLPHPRTDTRCIGGGRTTDADMFYRLRRYCEEAGFYKEREVTFPHKQSSLMKIRREAWTAPAL